MIFDHILVTTDLSDHSMTAFDIATYQAKATNARITLLSVFEDYTVPAILQKAIKDPEAVAEMKEEYRRKMTDKINELAKERFHRQDVTAKVIFSTNPPSEEIIKYAEEELVSLIIMATHGRGAIGDFFMGSVTQKVIQKTFCPVMVIPKV